MALCECVWVSRSGFMDEDWPMLVASKIEKHKATPMFLGYQDLISNDGERASYG